MPYSEGISSNASGSLVIKPCTQAEIDFYESAKDHPLFQAHMPTFIGSLSQSEDQDEVAPLVGLQGGGGGAHAIDGTAAGGVVTEPTPGLMKRASWKPSGGKKIDTGLAIVLENVASGFKHPNVLDVKLGARLWDDDAPQAKRQKLDEVAGRTTSGSLGFRVAGMKMWIGDDNTKTTADEQHVEVKNGYKSYTKLYGQSFSADNVVEAYLTYLGGGSRDSTTGKVTFNRPRAEFLARRLIREIESVQYVLENEESRMYSASVLMVYEGDEAALEESIRKEESEQQQQQRPEQDGAADEDEDDEDEDEDDVTPRKVHEVRLIDFAHADWTPGQGPDENALRGIRSVVRILREMVGSAPRE